MVKMQRREAIAKGLDRYFTGKPCRQGHVAERETLSGMCMMCKPIYYKQHMERTRKKFAEAKESRLIREQDSAK